tara:strand:- start:16376 stop:17593 length:1218 start_codon:yes stop_codon:yes gene_type:complete
MSHFNVRTPRFYPVKNLEISQKHDLGSSAELETVSGAIYEMQSSYAEEFANFNPWKPKTVSYNFLPTDLTAKVSFIYATGQYTQVTPTLDSDAQSLGFNYFGLCGHNFSTSNVKLRLVAINKNVAAEAAFEEEILTGYTPLFNCSVLTDEAGEWIVPTRYQDQYETTVDEDGNITDTQLESANGSYMFTFDPDQISEGFSRFFKVEMVPFDGANFLDNIEIGSFVWGRYFDMPHSPDLNYNTTVEYDNSRSMRTMGGADLVNINYARKPGFCDKYEGFGREGTNNQQVGRRSWNLNFSSLKSEYEGSWSDDTGVLFPESHLSNTEWRYGNNFYSRVLDVTMGGQLPFIFETDNRVMPENEDVVFWGTGEHNEAHFYVARFESDTFTFEHTSHKMFNISLEIKESW